MARTRGQRAAESAPSPHVALPSTSKARRTRSKPEKHGKESEMTLASSSDSNASLPQTQAPNDVSCSPCTTAQVAAAAPDSNIAVPRVMSGGDLGADRTEPTTPPRTVKTTVASDGGLAVLKVWYDVLADPFVYKVPCTALQQFLQAEDVELLTSPPASLKRKLQSDDTLEPPAKRRQLQLFAGRYYDMKGKVVNSPSPEEEKHAVAQDDSVPFPRRPRSPKDRAIRLRKAFRPCQTTVTNAQSSRKVSSSRNLQRQRDQAVATNIQPSQQASQVLIGTQGQSAWSAVTDAQPPQRTLQAQTAISNAAASQQTLPNQQDPQTQPSRPVETGSQVGPQHRLETPRRGWGFRSIIPSSVSRYFARSAPIAELQDMQSNESFASNTTGDGIQSTVSNDQDDGAQPEAIRADLSAADTTGTDRTNKQDRVVRTAAEEEQRRKEAILASAQVIIEAEVQRRLNERLGERQAEVEATSASQPHTKRKRLPSPDAIPNPLGGGHGMHKDSFQPHLSDDVEDESRDKSPAKSRDKSQDNAQEEDELTPPEDPDSPSARPGKRVRWSRNLVSATTTQIIGDPHRAAPYTGKLFAPYPPKNLFSECTPNRSSFKAWNSKPSKKKDIDRIWENIPEEHRNYSGRFDAPSPSDSDSSEEDLGTGKSPTTPETKVIDRIWGNIPEEHRNYSGHFAVPDASDSDDDLNRASPEQATPTPGEALQDATQTSPTKAAEPQTPVPPRRPSPAHAVLPSASNASVSGALARARAQATRYTPKQPSGLRAASVTSIPPESSSAGPGNLFARNVDMEEAGQLIDTFPEESIPVINFPAPTSYADYGFDPEVIRHLEKTWTEKDEESAVATFNRGWPLYVKW